MSFLSSSGQTKSSNNQLSHQAEAETAETNSQQNENKNDVGVTVVDGDIPATEKSDENDSNQSRTPTSDKSNDKNCDTSVDEHDKNQIDADAIGSKHLSSTSETTPFASIHDRPLPNGDVQIEIVNGEKQQLNGLLSTKAHGKKAVSLEKIDETVKKFISGEIIVDKENPFKKLNAKRRADFFSSTPANLQKTKVSFSIKDLPKEEFITKEDVLKESKYVKTYIKNPDEYFVYDPTLKARLLKEEQQELAAKNLERSLPPKKANGTRISKSTQDRLRELKNRYSPSNLNYNYHQPKVRTHLTNGYTNGYVASKLPTAQNKKIDRSKYPDLSQIKVKTGTDLEGSFFNPKEVAINAKKFDARIKNTQFGSQDDLEEIVDITSDFDPKGLEIDTTIEEKSTEKKVEKKEESLTNTINSKEFQKFLAEKGLTLLPQLRIVEIKNKMATPIIQNDADAKKRKPSMLQRLFSNGLFSSRRRTTPKDSTPPPIKVNANEQKKEGRLSSARRLVLHRQSMPVNCDAYMVKSNLQTVSSLGGSSSSISSTLTNVENSEYLESYRANCNKSLKPKGNDSDTTRSLSGLRYIDSSSNSTIVTCDKSKNIDQQTPATIKPVPRPRQHINGKSSVSSPLQTPLISKSCKEMLTSIQKIKAPENGDRDGSVKMRVRPKIPISNSRPLISHRNDGKSDQTEEKRVNGLSSEITKVESKRRLQSKLPERLNKVPTCVQPNKRNLCETSFEVQLNRGVTAKTPDSAKVPKSTSTPLTENTQPKFQSEPKKVPFEQSLNLSPIPKQNDSALEQQVNIGTGTWIREQELQGKSYRQFYSQPLLVQAHMNVQQPIAYTQRMTEQPIYDRLPAHQSMLSAQPLYAKVEKKPAVPMNVQFIRNAPHRQSLDQIKLYAAQQQALNPAIIYQQPVFIRNSPQRNTISGIYRSHPAHRISPQIVQNPQTILQAQQPQRPQSVLDEMMTGRNAQSTPSPNVQLRRNPLSRGEIMNQVIEFCRKSMNRTPTKFFGSSTEQVATVHKDATSSEVSPISYASVTPSKTSPSIASSRSGKIGPQVPIRKQSLQQQQANTKQTDQHPIYERIPKQNIQTPTRMVNDENKQMNGMISHYAVPQKRYIMVDSEDPKSAHLKQQMNGSHSSLNQPVYIQSAAQKNYAHAQQELKPSYEYVNVRSNSHPSLGNNLLQIYHPQVVVKQTNHPVDRRVFLPTIPQNQQINGIGNTNAVEMHLPAGYTKAKVVPKHGRIIMLNNIEQMYRPIALPAKNIRYQTSQTSLDSRQSADTIDSLQSHKRGIIQSSEYILE